MERLSKEAGSSVSSVGLEISTFVKRLERELNWDELEVRKMLAKLDHRDAGKLTWIEFVSWYEAEG